MTSTQATPIPKLPPVDHDVLYFAFGSNMAMAQMAKRCPDCRLFARGILRGHKWETNAKGGGNVVKVNDDDYVEGILWTLTPTDLELLRPHEGLDWGYFTEQKRDFEIEPLTIKALEGQKASDAAELLEKYKNGTIKAPEAILTSTEQKKKVIQEALIYISLNYKGPADIREEYVGRMEAAMADARLLGMTNEYCQRAIYPFINGPRTSKPTPVQVKA
ncbi:hypothetical protein F5Y16DRAFT_422335 [Xylariaceae sp. FL0255]|nr:hypothetical protein F5Y16DRAFT_422335 [Xylariaceae sp. FL0255]